jgi:hypothetical protein
MIKLLRYESKGEGIRVYGPIYIPLEVLIEASFDTVSKRRKEMRMYVEKDAIVLPKIIDIDGEIEFIYNIYDREYLFKPNRKGKIRAKINFEPTNEYSEEDLLWDNHIGDIVKRVTDNLVSHIINIKDVAYKIYEYINRIPFTNERIRGPSKPRTPTQVIKSNRARKCVCKAELFKDMCRVLGIPARDLSAEHYRDQDIERYAQRDKKYGFNRSHAFCAFYDNGWHLVDPTMGGFGAEFKVQNYYDRLIAVEGTYDVKVTAKEL